MEPKQIKAGRRLRKLLAKYKVNKIWLENEVMEVMSDLVDIYGGRAIDNFKRYGNKIYVRQFYLVENPDFDDKEFEVTFEAIGRTHGEGKRAGWLNIKITNIKGVE